MNAQTNVNNSGQKIRTVDITVTAAMAALVFLGTYIFKIPTISGYVHLGDCMIILTVALFGMKKGAVAGAIGGGLSDFIGGYFYWVVPTLLIKCMWALVMGPPTDCFFISQTSGCSGISQCSNSSTRALFPSRSLRYNTSFCI